MGSVPVEEGTEWRKGWQLGKSHTPSKTNEIQHLSSEKITINIFLNLHIS